MPPLMDTPLLTMEVMVMKNPNTTAQFKTSLKSPMCASQLSKLSVPPLNWPSKSLSTKNSTTKSPVQCVLNPSTSSPMKSVLTLTNKKLKKLPPRLSKRKKMSKWSLSANLDTMDTDMDLMDTTTARKLPKPPLTTCLLSPPSMSP